MVEIEAQSFNNSATFDSANKFIKENQMTP